MSEAEFNIDSLLDGTLDDLANVPGYQVYPPGNHKVTINWKKPTKDRPTTIGLELTAIETLELNDSADTPLVPGTKSGVSFKMDNEYGQTAFRAVIAALAEHYGAGTNREIMEKSEGAECLVVTKIRQGKKQEGKPVAEYTDIVEIGVI